MKKALLIGIDYFDVSGISLKGCINDVINMRNMLIDAYDYESNNIMMLRDDDAVKFPGPTRDNIVDCLIDLVLESANLEEIWLHYSGHGSQIQNQNCYSEKTYINEGGVPGALKMRECINGDKMQILVPVDYKTKGCITDKDLYDMVRRFKCRAILTFDCCHSGTVCDLPWTTEYQVPSSLQQVDVINQDKSKQSGMLVTTKINDAIIKNPYILMISGCRDDQTSLDTINGMDQRSGAFTNALCECLRKRKHNTSILSLYKDICIYLLDRGYEQIPILSSTVESPKHTFAKSYINYTEPSVEFVRSNTARNLLEPYYRTQSYGKTPSSYLGFSMDESYCPGDNTLLASPTTRFIQKDQQMLMHQYKNGETMTDSQQKVAIDETGSFFPITSSGDSVSTSSTKSSGLSSFCRHFYKKKTGRL